MRLKIQAKPDKFLKFAKPLYGYAHAFKDSGKA